MQDILPQDDSVRSGAGEAGPHGLAARDAATGQAGLQERAPVEGAGAPPRDKSDAGSDTDRAADDTAVVRALGTTVLVGNSLNLLGALIMAQRGSPLSRSPERTR